MGQSQSSKFDKLFTLICTNNIDELTRQLRSSPEQTTSLANLADTDKAATLLMYAAFYGNMIICRLLIDSGATLFSRDNEGRNVLYYTIAGQSYNIAKYFIETVLADAADDDMRKAFINNADNAGETCLHEAVKVHAVSCIELLLKYEINVNIVNGDGVTALHRAVDLGTHEHKDARVYRTESFSSRSSRYRSSTSQVQVGSEHERCLGLDTAACGIGTQRCRTRPVACQPRCTSQCYGSSGPFALEVGT